MIKFKLLLGIFFLLAFQVGYSSCNFHLENASRGRGIESKNQSLVGENNFSSNLLGGFALGLAPTSVFAPCRECFFSNSKSKNLQKAIIQRTWRSKTEVVRSASFDSNGGRVVNLPIYLQMGNLKI